MNFRIQLLLVLLPNIYSDSMCGSKTLHIHNNAIFSSNHENCYR